MKFEVRNYNAKANWNIQSKSTPDPSDEEKKEFEQTAELIEEALRQKHKVYVTDPFRGDVLFEVKRFNRQKYLFYLFQPESVATAFGRRSFEIVMTRSFWLKEISGDNQIMWFFTDQRSFLNAEPVKIVEYKEIIKKEQIVVEKNSSDSIKKKQLSKDIEKIQHTLQKRYSHFQQDIANHVITELKKELQL